MTDLLTLMTARGFTPRKTSTNNGGEYCSPCPVCGDGNKGGRSDRFHIWPSKETGGKCAGRFWCRQCGIAGDTIAFLQKVDGVSFVEACNELGVLLPRQAATARGKRYQAPPVPLYQQRGWQPTSYPEPPALWQEKAGNLLADCQARLQTNEAALQWLADRGITSAMAEAYGLGYNCSSRDRDRYRPRASWGLAEKMQNGQPKKLWLPKGWVIPARTTDGRLVQLRIRRTAQDIAAFAANIKYLQVGGSSPTALVLHPQAEVLVVVESGFDAILVAGLFAGKIGAVTTWNSSARPDTHAHQVLRSASLVLGGLDYDQGGDREQQWWQATYPQYKRLPPLAGGAKDPGDAHQAGHDVRQWVVDGLPKGLRIKLGFATQARTLPPKNQQKPAKTGKNSSKQPPPPPPVEIELTNGQRIYVTDDRQQWQALSEQGKAVFSQNELDRLKEATRTMEPADRLQFAMATVATKQELGGYVRAGRCTA